ncbi:FAD:protein FMN transferase [Marinobacterium jannaschii]|uniref:FAD:protein FMN transferase n=1 Tax=Marinobacterium jannaschii TaxID=64970 RepID=UPI000489F721|nr:FAD:protein FMN transferase [Marinobacterium jannaschii]
MTALIKQYMKWPAALLLAAFFIVACQQAPKARVEVYNGFTMGTTFSVKWVAEKPETKAETGQKITQILAQVNASMSTYIPDSELSLLNASVSTDYQDLSAGLAEVLAMAQQISERSGGAFDVTVGPLVNLWGFGPDGRVIKAPESAEIERQRRRIGFDKLELDTESQRIRKLTPSLYIDLSAIAKGYGVDKVAELLEENGFSSYLVEIGGELRARGVKPDGSSWKVAIESPVDGERAIQRVIEVDNIGIATSGDYRNYFEENGIRFSHTIDPHTGVPVSHKLASVTVLAPSCAEADATATAISVLGPEKGYKHAVDHGVEALFITKSGQGFKESMTPGFEKYLLK